MNCERGVTLLDIKKNYSIPSYVNSNCFSATYEFSNLFYEYVCEKQYAHKDIIILCIGTDRATGDSLGPLIGYKLLGHNYILANKIKVYGSLENPVHAKNLEEKIQEIYSLYDQPLVIAIDACLGRMEYIGYMTIGKGSVRPGAGVKKDLPSVGDIYITGIVNYSGVVDITILQNTRLSIVMKMADIISNSMIGAFKRMELAERRHYI